MSEPEKPRILKNSSENYEFLPKDTVLTMRISSVLLEQVKENAKLKNMDYQKFIRLLLEKNINKIEGV